MYPMYSRIGRKIQDLIFFSFNEIRVMKKGNFKFMKIVFGTETGIKPASRQSFIVILLFVYSCTSTVYTFC